MAEKTLEMQQLNFPQKRLQKPYFLPNEIPKTVNDSMIMKDFAKMRILCENVGALN